MSGILMDLARILMIGVLTFLVYRFGQRNSVTEQKGWKFFLYGLGFILFGGVWDFLRNFDQLSPYFMIGGVNFKFIFENFLGYLAGLLFILIGLSQWLPNVELIYTKNRNIQEVENSLRDASTLYERTIAEKTDELSETYHALHETEAKLSAFMKHAKAAIGVKDAEGRYAAVNPVTEKNYGMNSEQILGRLPSDLFPPEVSRQLEASDKKVLESGDTLSEEVSGEIWGAHRTFLTEKFPINAPDGYVIGIGAISTEITKQKMVEASLAQSEKRYRELFEQSPVPFMEEDWSAPLDIMRDLSQSGVLDFEGYFVNNPSIVKKLYDGCVRKVVSKAMIKLYGAKSADEFEHEMLHKSAHPSEVEGFTRAVVALFQGAIEYEYQANELTAEGTPIVTRIRFSIPQEYAGNWKRVLASIEDVTNRVAVEDRLRKAQKFEAIGQLSGGIAHDFNNLLAVIQGCCEFLENTQEYDAMLVHDIMNAVTRGASLTHRLLAYSSQQILAPKRIELAVLVDGLNEMLKRLLGETIDVHVTTVGDLWPVNADPGQVEDALLNLAINARDAMPSGGKLEIECANVVFDAKNSVDETEVRSGEYVVLAVRDTGSGMSKNTQSRAFEPFFTTKDVGEGSGLGLSMVYGFAKQSGGHVSIESEVNKGTAVRIYLPREIKIERIAEKNSREPLVLGNGETIFVIEDDPAVRQLVVRMISSLGYQSIQAAHAAEARAILSKGLQFDVILSDVVLPGGISGPDLALELLAQNANAKIIFMSGYPSATAKPVSSLGAEDVLLNKPFRRDALARTLREVLMSPNDSEN